MQVTEQGLPSSGHTDRTGGWYVLVLLLIAVALGCHQREGMGILAPMISRELRLGFPDIGGILASLALASTAGFLLMAVFIWREKSWLGYAVLGILGGVGALLTGASSGVGGLIVAATMTGIRRVGPWSVPYRRRLALAKVSCGGDWTRICRDKVHGPARTDYHCGGRRPRRLALGFGSCGGVVVCLGTSMDLVVSPNRKRFAA